MTNLQTLSVCLLDDERIALLSLKNLLQKEEGVFIQCATTSIPDLLQSMQQRMPDALFLDIQMPEANGFEVAEKIPASLPVIFVTASDAHAIRAFEVNALDYLVKPVQPSRLQKSLQRLRINGHIREKSPLLNRHDLVCLSLDHGRLFVPAANILSIESKVNYSRIHLLDSRQFIIKRSLNDWEKRLDPNHFYRISRSCIIQLDQIERVESKSLKCLIHLKGNSSPLSTSRRKGQSLKNLLKKPVP